MRLERRRLTAQETDHEVLWLSVGLAAAALAAGAAWGLFEWPHLVCPLKEVTGWPCPTCGTTRALFALLRGDLAAALGWNPAAVVVALAYAAFAMYAAVTLACDLPRLRIASGQGLLLPARWTIGLATLGTWAYLVAAGR